ncbi:MAG: class I SAM-dependent methyltransferase [Chloroflexi bacterium]|nr:class I SAM-dependent methyltransferase [Chloroflexota bacterium]MCI0576483.1 class I SAM-dependent methyltransferase [Chloroflexota bacterium]MCI0649541.1 class I SAM-dependent methyltransferase [Chloroflexota bacterium]MCI0729383.1 class I SAM-dependent methyltransferase [Chloroflexota bacterium]
MSNRFWLYNFVPGLKQPVSRRWYEYISRLDRDAHMLFMNFGYTSLDPAHKPLALSAEEEPHRYPLQLYHHVASAIDWTGLDALEVGSGRGGGAAYVMRRFKPRSLTGIDITANAVSFCQRYHVVEGLSFRRGDAESLPFADHSFGVVMNVESSLYYPNVERFFSEVVRVLRPDGYFLYADIRYADEVERWRGQLRDTGLRLSKEENITPNVVRALELDRERRQTLIRRYTPRLLLKPTYHFAGVTGAELARDRPKDGERLYLNFCFRKGGEAS